MAPEAAELIPVGDDGLGALLFRLPPGAELDPPLPAASDGTFAMVLGGSLRHEGATLQPWESLFVSADEPFPRVLAGPEGAEVALLFMPPKAEAYR